MKKTLHILLMTVLLIMTAACVEELPQPGVIPVIPAEVELHFDSSHSSAVTVSTKSDMGTTEEQAVHNLYVFVFDASGNKLFGYLFNSSCLFTTVDLAKDSGLDNWWASQEKVIHFNAAIPDDGQCTLVGVANVDDEKMGVSSESLSLVRNLDDLSNTATLWVEFNQKTVFRSGYFLMCDSLDKVVLTKDNGVFQAPAGKKFQLERLDAKVTFNVQVLPALEGDPKVASFTPLKWRVFNVPSQAYLLPHNTDKAESAGDFFDTQEMNFETDSVSVNYIAGHPQYLKHSFTFYMQENRPALKDQPSNWTYADRERRGTDGKFLYANDLATYVELTGHLQMEAEERDAILGADVTYLIHLGDFGGTPPDYSQFGVERNHHYTYNIYIRNADDIRVQAENGTVINPGASGHVLVAKNELYTCDAHNSSHVFTLKGTTLSTFDISGASWYVESLFGSGSPDEDGIELDDLDYKWVEFRINERQGTTGYKPDRAPYQPHVDNHANGTYYINELLDYLKAEMAKRGSNNTNPESAFYGGDSINVTAFINEYYYTSHPTGGAYDPGSFWKQFVNKPMRRMHMLAGSYSEAIKINGGSERFGTVFSIQQKSIQTIYNINHDDLTSAWGCEHFEEEDEHHAPSTSVGHIYTKTNENVDRGNTSMWNGRENSFRIWDWRWEDVTQGSTTHTHIYRDRSGGSSPLQWEDYLNLTAKNGDPLMKSDYQYVRYECMSRNRDNDGDGYIDKDEVQWYMGATNQLIGLFLGWHGIEGAARLYQRTAEEKQGSNWRQRVLSSTRDDSRTSYTNSDKYPRVIWAEQGVNGSVPEYADGDKNFSTRCLRNLGASGNQDFTFADTSAVPQPYLEVHRKSTQQASGDYSGDFNDYVYYEFDCSYMNAASLRGYTDNELVSHDEDAEAAFLYSHFVSAPRGQQPTFDAILHRVMNNSLDTYGINPYCPDGYRLPNIRELTVYRFFIPNNDKTKAFNTGYAFSRTYWSLGSEGLKKTSEYGWGASNQKMVMTTDGDTHKTTTVRCVKDVR